MTSKGLEFLHARQQLRRASDVEEKNTTFSRLGFRALQVGLQKIPVVLTPAMNLPSN